MMSVAEYAYLQGYEEPYEWKTSEDDEYYGHRIAAVMEYFAQVKTNGEDVEPFPVEFGSWAGFSPGHISDCHSAEPYTQPDHAHNIPVQAFQTLLPAYYHYTVREGMNGRIDLPWSYERVRNGAHRRKWTTGLWRWDYYSRGIHFITHMPGEFHWRNLAVEYGSVSETSTDFADISHLTDGDRESEMEGSNVGYPQWIEVDLGQDMDLRGIGLWFSREDYEYKIETKAEGASYSPKIDRTSRSTDEIGWKWEIQEFDGPVVARYVKVTITGNLEGHGADIDIDEFEIYKAQSSTSTSNSSPHHSVLPATTGRNSVGLVIGGALIQAENSREMFIYDIRGRCISRNYENGIRTEIAPGVYISRRRIPTK
jgi:hypothetical protein